MRGSLQWVLVRAPAPVACMSFALLCSGQGHQHPGMFDKLEPDPEAQRVLKDAARALGADVRAWLKGPDDIFGNFRAQPLICVAQLAAWRALRDRLPMPALLAGYSVGELTSYACADALDVRDLCGLAVNRARAMDESARLHPGALLVVDGLRGEELERLGDGLEIWRAIILSETRCIVGGISRDVDRLALAARARGAQVQGLRVRIAAHTPLLSSAVAPFRAALEASNFSAPRIPVMAGVDASMVTRSDDGIELLCRQLTEPIDWSRCLQTIYERGCRVVLELGPGAALARMIHERFPDAQARSLDDFRSVRGAAEW